jgi:post-segregation antitoxin (ccd killing protein)
MISAGIATAATSVGSGILSSIGSGKAAKAEESYLNKALQFQEGVYNTTQTNLSPWISGGQTALSQYMGGLGLSGGTGGGTGGALSQYWNAFTKTPYYTFPLQQGQQTLAQQAAARGLNLSTGTVQGMSNYTSNYAAQNWNSYMNALNSLSNTGQTAATNLGQVGATVGQEVGTTSSGLAAAAGSGIMGQYGGIANALSGIGLGAMVAGNMTGSGTSTPQTNTNFSGYAPSITPGTTNYLGTGYNASPVGATGGNLTL